MNERSRFAIEVGLAVMLTCLAVCALAMSLATEPKAVNIPSTVPNKPSSGAMVAMSEAD